MNINMNEPNSIKKPINVRQTIFIFLVILVLILLVFSISQFNKSKNIQQAQNYFESAGKYLLASDFDSAERDIKLAVELNPDSQLISELLMEIEATQRAKVLIVDAKSLKEIGRNQEAYDLLKKAVAPRPEITSEVKNLKNELIPLIQGEVNAEVSQLIRNKKYSEAQSSLNSAISLFAGEKEILQIFMSEYDKVSKLKQEQVQISLSKLSKRYDKFQDTTWYTSPNSPRYRNYNAFYIYFGVSENSKLPLRLVVQYESDDWLFIDSAAINVDGQNYDIYGDWERDNNSRIWEWIDEKLEDKEMIEAIIKSKSAVIRFEGSQYYNTRTISPAQKNALRDILLAYDGLRG